MRQQIKAILSSEKSWVLADQAVFSGNSFFATILMARIFAPSDFGVYASIILFIYLLVSVLNAIIIQPLQVTMASISNKKSYISFNFWTQILLVIFFGFLIYIVLKLNFSIFDFYSNLSIGLILFSAGFVMHDFFRKLFLAQAKIKFALSLDVITSVFHFSILFAALLFVHLSLHEIIIYLGLGYIPAFLFGVWVIKPKITINKDWKVFFTKHYHQSKWLLMTALVQWWSSNLFVVASGVVLGIEALGAFRLVQSLFGVLNVLLQTFENYALPQTARLLLNSKDEAKKYLRSISIKSAMFFGGVLLVTFLFSKFIIVLAGGETYADYAYVVKGMALLYLFIFVGYPVRMSIRVLVLNKHFFFGYVFSLVFSLTSFEYLLGNWGLVGAITGLICSQIILISFWQYILIKNKFLLWK